MNILIINQPTGNRGDEAAHRSLVRSLLKLDIDFSLSVLFIGEDRESTSEMKVISKDVKYIDLKLHRGFQRLAKIAFRYNLIKLFVLLHPQVRKAKRFINESDLVLNAPGGICMGLFQNWKHLLWLKLAKMASKDIAYYSRSFGPFLENTKDDIIFMNNSIELLKYFKFLSIRDKKTMMLADQLNLNYTKSIDSAFLDQPSPIVPVSIKEKIGTNDYIVFVPNSLNWHPAYNKNDQDKINFFYIQIVNLLIKRFPDSKIVLLPQLYNSKNFGDKEYFDTLRNRLASDQIIVLPDTYSSDLQQSIIASSKFVIGARYHSVVFAINNSVPVIALSYEHKIAGLLNILKMDDDMIDISKLGNSDFDIEKNIKILSNKLDNLRIRSNAKSEANHIANQCFDKFINKFNLCKK